MNRLVSLLVPLSLAHARVLVCVSVRTATEDSSHHTDRQILRSAGPARIMDECDCNCNCNAESAKRECARCDLSLSLPPCFGWRGCVCVLYCTVRFMQQGSPVARSEGKASQPRKYGTLHESARSNQPAWLQCNTRGEPRARATNTLDHRPLAKCPVRLPLFFLWGSDTLARQHRSGLFWHHCPILHWGALIGLMATLANGASAALAAGPLKQCLEMESIL